MSLDGTMDAIPIVIEAVPTHRAPPRIRLIGDSVVQVLSFAISRVTLEQTRRTFCQDGDGADALLQSFSPDSDVPADAHGFTLDGCQSADALAGEWLPMPCLRRQGHDGEDGSPQGPNNWVRIRLESEGSDFRVVLAFDTWLANSTENDARGDVSPTLEDARRGTTFRFASGLSDLEHFIGEPWIDDWISLPPATAAMPTPERTLVRLAQYVTLLAALKSADLLPDVELSGSAAAGSDMPSARHVDLCITFGDGEAAAYLVDVARFDAGAASAVTPLALRDLQRPWITHSGRGQADAVFSRPHFGREALSRQSGRVDAFAWPSLVRVGGEATTLRLLQPADAPRSGLVDVLASLLDDTPNDAVWRVAGGDTRSSFVSGSTVALLTEAGERVAGETGRTRATRARFSNSALTALTIQEFVVQAIAASNAADLATDPGQRSPTRLGTVRVTLPDAMQPFERDIAHRRIRDGVALAFDALRWTSEHAPDVAFAPTRVQANLHAYLHNEIAHRFGGNAPAYLRLLCGPVRPAPTSIAVAALELTANSLAIDVSVVTGGDDAQLALSPDIDDTAGVGLDDVVAAIAGRVVVPALVRHLEKARLTKPRAFLARMLQATAIDDVAAVQASQRLVHDTILPAARRLLALHHRPSTSADTIHVDTTLRALLADNVDRPTLRRLEDLAIAEGANATSLLDAAVVASAADIRAIVTTVLAPAVRAACRTVRRRRCTLLLLAGHPAVTGILAEIALAEACVAPDRVVDLTTYRFGAWAGPHGDGAACQVAGNMLASRRKRASEPAPATHFVAFDDASPRGRHPLFTVHPKRAVTSDDVTTSFSFDGTPMLLGVSRIDSAQWPLNAVARLQMSIASPAKQPALPLTVGLALDSSGTLSPGKIEIRSVRDARGRNLPPTVLELKAVTRRGIHVPIDDEPLARITGGGLE